MNIKNEEKGILIRKDGKNKSLHAMFFEGNEMKEEGRGLRLNTK